MKVPLRALAKINPFPSFPTKQLQLMFRGRGQGLSNVRKAGTLCHTEVAAEDHELSFHRKSFVCSAKL